MGFDSVIKGGKVVTPDGVQQVDVGIKGETIAAIGAGLDTSGANVIDAAGYFVLPGVLDVHTVNIDSFRTFA
jgi:dihydropyrimidinase